MTLYESCWIMNYPILEEDYNIIVEAGEGPRWRFNYDRYRVDPRPDILLLGAYRHPSTNNDLVGGINLHYLSTSQRNALARVLPQIMAARDLYSRYWTGRRLIPDVFQRFYRTYNADHIRGVQRDTMYPKYGLLKTAGQWLKKKLSGAFKSREQRRQEAEPKFPQDLQSMQDKLDQVVQQIATEPQPVEPSTPEMQAARDAFQQFQREKTLRDIEHDEDMPLRQEIQGKRVEQGDVKPSPGMQLEPQQSKIDPVELRKEQAQQEQDLEDPSLEVDLDELAESIIYYSPLARRYVIEPAYQIVHSMI